VQGTCDLLLQNCPSPYTCTVQQAGSTWRTECATVGTGTKTLGTACQGHSDCAPGLRCTVNKCTRPCCSQREAAICKGGQCDLSVYFGSGGTGRINVCTFSPTCSPWAGNCPAGPERDCHAAGNDRFLCDVPNYSPDGGSTIGKPCTYRNDCGDSQYCQLTSSSGTVGVCRWLCRATATGGPDAGAVGGQPGQGGCPGGTACRAFSSPSWLGVCLPP